MKLVILLIATLCFGVFPFNAFAKEKVTTKEVLAEVKTIVTERKACFLRPGSASERVKVCRKDYMKDIVAAAKKGYGKPQMGRFLLCIRECPIEVAMCRGDIELGLRKDSCDGFENQCVKQCLIEFYW